MGRKVLVSGCFDLLHSGHMTFLQAAARYGDLHVAIGSDATVMQLKGRPPVYPDHERLYMVRSLACVTDAFISSGHGFLDFEPEFRAIRPDVFVVNEDGASAQKEALCTELDVQYTVLNVRSTGRFPGRSTTNLRANEAMPYRIDLAGGWLDQPFVSAVHPGAVLTLSIEPTLSFNERSGMATSTRNKAIELWGGRLPAGDALQLAHVLFCYDNPPGTVDVSGSQDAIGIVLSGLARAYYAGGHWPASIDRLQDESTLQFAESAISLLPLRPRSDDYNPTAERRVTRQAAEALAMAADDCWQALRKHDLTGFGSAMRRSFEAQVAMFPNMLTPLAQEMIDRYRSEVAGWKLSGAGGGGYVIVVSEKPISNAVRIRARRDSL